mgnify:CR=1 FL=1
MIWLHVAETIINMGMCIRAANRVGLPVWDSNVNGTIQL